MFAGVGYDPGPRKLHVFNVFQNLVARKVDGILLSCFISHAFIDELAAAVDTPIINMMQGLQDHVRQRHAKARTIGILTSDYVREKKRCLKGISPTANMI